MARTIGTLLVTAALVAGACGGDDASDDAGDVTVPIAESTTTSSSTTEPTTTTTTEDPKAAVEQAFYDQWDAFVEITSAPDIEHPLIDQHFTGEAKEALLDGVSRLLASGYAIRRPDNPDDFQPVVNDIHMVSPSEATVFECTLDGLVVYRRSSGEIVDDSVDRLPQRNDFVLIDGQWRAADLRETLEDEPRCAF